MRMLMVPRICALPRGRRQRRTTTGAVSRKTMQLVRTRGVVITKAPTKPAFPYPPIAVLVECRLYFVPQMFSIRHLPQQHFILAAHCILARRTESQVCGR